jgi:asparagine synthase (glutamine-hydrolysing)
VSAEEIRHAVEAMVQRVVHRGPDDRGQACYHTTGPEGALGLGNTRLAIVDLSPAGHQPMEDPETGNWIVYNGEVYNFQELRHDLEMRGFQFKSQTDTEVVLKAYACYGRNCVNHFRGMFAFAIWDPKHQELFLARDRLGIKPLYYYADGGTFIFSSEVRALLASGLAPRRLSLAGLDSYLALGAVQDPLTMIEGVNALPAGHYGIWKDGEFTIRPYWTLPTRVDEELARWPRQKIVEHLQELLEESVHLRLISDVPLGAFLSGGIDSSAVVSLLSRISPISPRTVSIVFEEPEFCEVAYMRLIARKFGTVHTEITLTAEDFLKELPHAIADMDQPTFDGVNTYIVSKYTRQAGLTVALSGLGGDELFAGYHNSFVTAPRLERLRQWLPGPAGQAVGALTRYVLQDRDGGRKLERWFQKRDLDGGAYFLIRELFSPATRCRLVPALRGVSPVKGQARDEFKNLDVISQISALELSHYTRNVLLRDTDAMSMAHALEVRVPLLDHKLVEFVLSLPASVKVNGRQPKPLLVDAVRDLPSEVVNRRKQGFTLPFAVWLRCQLKETVGTVLRDAHIEQLPGGLDRAAIGEIWQRFLAGKGVWARLWALYVLVSWCERNL